MAHQQRQWLFSAINALNSRNGYTFTYF